MTEQRLLLELIDRRTDSMASDLPVDVVRALRASGGANENGANRHAANNGHSG